METGPTPPPLWPIPPLWPTSLRPPAPAQVHEAKRLLRPGGLLMFADNNPRSKVIQGLPPVLYTLMKSTEPHSDSYFAFDLEQAMRDAGFQHVITRESDPRHRTVLGHL